MLNSPIVVALIIAIPLGAIVALFAAYYIGSTRNRVRFEESLRAQKETSEQRLLDVQGQQHQALREAREASNPILPPPGCVPRDGQVEGYALSAFALCSFSCEVIANESTIAAGNGRLRL